MLTIVAGQDKCVVFACFRRCECEFACSFVSICQPCDDVGTFPLPHDSWDRLQPLTNPECSTKGYKEWMDELAFSLKKDLRS